MSFVKNGHLLGLSPENLALLEKRAELHRRYSSIEFKVLDCSPEKITVRVVQSKSHAGVYFDQKRLVEIVRETFADLGGWSAVFARPIPYDPPPTDVVTPEWIREKIAASGLNMKELSHRLGVDANTLIAYKNGLKPLSGVVRAMFFHFFSK
jgi:hypothetical protein